MSDSADALPESLRQVRTYPGLFDSDRDWPSRGPVERERLRAGFALCVEDVETRRKLRSPSGTPPADGLPSQHAVAGTGSAVKAVWVPCSCWQAGEAPVPRCTDPLEPLYRQREQRQLLAGRSLGAGGPPVVEPLGDVRVGSQGAWDEDVGGVEHDVLVGGYTDLRHLVGKLVEHCAVRPMQGPEGVEEGLLEGPYEPAVVGRPVVRPGESVAGVPPTVAPQQRHRRRAAPRHARGPVVADAVGGHRAGAGP